jgi:hypothetical protein
VLDLIVEMMYNPILCDGVFSGSGMLDELMIRKHMVRCGPMFQ